MGANWETWSDWGTCSQSCGGGVQRRIRTCDDPEPSEGKSCQGDTEKIRECQTNDCGRSNSL